MCGRYSLKNDSLRRIAVSLDVEAASAESRYNIAPGQMAPVFRQADDRHECRDMRWGLIPHWSKTPTTQYSTINARVETVASKPTYRDAFKRRRCLVPADGYYEWQQQDGHKQPYFIHQNGEPFVFAGLWDHWGADTQDAFDSYSIVTTAAAASVGSIHARMPVILPRTTWAAWLDPATSQTKLADVLSHAETALQMHPVSTRVNNPRIESPSLIDPLP